MRGRSAGPSRLRVEPEHAHGPARRARGSPRASRRSSSCPRRSGPSRPNTSPRGDAEADAVDGAAVAVALLEPGDLDRPLGSAIHRAVSLSAGRRPAGAGLDGSRQPVAPGDERARARRARPWPRRSIGTRSSAVEALVDQPLDRPPRSRRPRRCATSRSRSAAISSAARSRRRPARAGARSSPSARGGRGGEQRGELALAQVVADRLAGDGLGAEHAEQVVAQLERLAEREPERAERRLQLVEPAGERGAEVQRALDRVLARLVPLDASGPAPASRPPVAVALEVEELADAELDAELVEDRARPSAAHAAISTSAYTNAKSPTRIAAPSPKRRAWPRQPRVAVAVDERAVHRGLAAAAVGPVHDVVVHEGEAVQQLERGARVDGDRVVRVAAGADERPVAERGPQPLAARDDQRRAARRARSASAGSTGCQRCALGVEQHQDAGLRPVADRGEAGRRVGRQPCRGPDDSSASDRLGPAPHRDADIRAAIAATLATIRRPRRGGSA